MITGWHRPTRIIVHPKRITENVRWHKAQLPEETEIFAVVKANGYGHGAVAVANAAKLGGATGFCVALLDEALQLRSAGIIEPILILNMVDVHYLPLVVENNLAITCGNAEWLADVLEQIATTPLKGRLRLHIKVDTGMGRIGFGDSKDVNAAAEKIIACPQLEFAGIYTHFSTADEKNTDFFEQQLLKFKETVGNLPVQPRYIHSSNSATALWHNAGLGNMVRLGVSMYGLNPSGHALSLDAPLHPAFELVSELIQVKFVPAGTEIGYGKTYTSEQAEWIGTVPIGYADGWLRHLQGFKVLVDGQFCEIVGRICMDQLMIRLPKQFANGTQVTLIGVNGDQEITVQSVADYLGTIHYEVCCQLSDRIPRIYTKG